MSLEMNTQEILDLILFFIPGYSTSRNFILSFGFFSFSKIWDKKKEIGFQYEIFQSDRLIIRYLRSEWNYKKGITSFLLTSKIKFKGKKKFVTQMLSGAMFTKNKAGFCVSRKKGVMAFKEEIIEDEVVTTIDRSSGIFSYFTTRKGNLYIGEQLVSEYNVLFSSSGSLLSISHGRKKLKFKEYGIVKGYNDNRYKFKLRYGYKYVGNEMRKVDLSSFFEDIKDHLEMISEVIKDYTLFCNQLLSELKEKQIVY